MKWPDRLFSRGERNPLGPGTHPWPTRRRTRYFAPAGLALQRYVTARDFAESTPERETCTEIDRRLHKIQYLWDGIHEQAEVVAPAEPDTSNMMDAFRAMTDSMTGGADLLFEIEIEMEAAFYNAWRVRQAARKLPLLGAVEVPKVEFVRNQILEHPNYAMILAQTSVSLGSGRSPALSATARQEPDVERFRGHSFEECMEEFRDRMAAAFDAGAAEPIYPALDR